MKHNFFIKRNGYNVKRGPLKKHKIIPLNLILKVEKQYLKAFPSSKKLSILETYLPVCWAGEFWAKMRKKETSWSTIIQGDKDKKVKLLPQIKRFEKNVLISLPSGKTISAKPSCQPPRNIFPTNPRNPCQHLSDRHYAKYCTGVHSPNPHNNLMRLLQPWALLPRWRNWGSHSQQVAETGVGLLTMLLFPLILIF